MVTLENIHGSLYGQISPATRVASIDTLYVNPTRQGKGTALYKEFEAKAKPDTDLIVIEIVATNERAIQFWTKLGFVYEGLLDQGYLEYTKTLN
jgi:GNAT superfamily N-acetyltransferase